MCGSDCYKQNYYLKRFKKKHLFHINHSENTLLKELHSSITTYSLLKPKIPDRPRNDLNHGHEGIVILYDFDIFIRILSLLH